MFSKRKYLLCTTTFAGLMAVAAPAVAQEQLPGVNVQGQSDQEATEIGEVVVTGSRIRRDPTNAPTPLIQVTREELLSTGQSTMIDYLATIPALANSLVPSDTTGSNLNDGGLSFANLRSLGTGRTLTLVDGRRHVGAAEGSLAVDVDAIPRLLVENIEIVTGGASSVYGADAVSGVLNFILRKDFEGLEIDANYGMINQEGQANKRISALAGVNLFDDRLNLYGFAEIEDIDEVGSMDIDWMRDGRGFVNLDADPTSARNDGNLDSMVIGGGVRSLSRPRWGQTTLANSQQPSPLNDPDVPLTNCVTTGTVINTSGNCYSLDPTRTYVYEGTTARLANFGQRLGNTGANRTLNIGGDGDPVALFGQESRVPQSNSARYQVGANFAVRDNMMLRAEYKLIEEDTFDVSQPTFYDFFLDDAQYAANQVSTATATNSFGLRYSDTAFLPANVRAAIATNTITNYTTNANTPGTPLAPVARAWARHSMFGPQRTQDNHREIERYVISLNGDIDQLGFISNIAWDLGYTAGEARNRNIERGTDNQRFNLAADAYVDVAGIVNGRPGEIVCRSRFIQASGGAPADSFRGGLLTDTAEGSAALAACVPLNIFGAGNQSQAALDYIDASITVSHVNQQEQAVAAVSGQLWDFFGAGPIGVAIGGEYRHESTEGIGRSTGTGNRSLFLNTGADFAFAEYESEEVFAELSIPLFRDTWLGEYAELSGSYRYFDYTTAGEGEVYGVNLVYRPIRDIAFKSSFNTSFRAPNLTENFRPNTQTFANGFVDPCATLVIAGQSATIRANRIANCTALAAAQGFTFDFAGATSTNTDDFNPTYTSGIAGVTGGNPLLSPETSESFTFSTVLQPRFIPNLSIVFDYYEIQINDVIAAVSAQQLSNNCVSGPTLNANACATLVRLNPAIPFGFGNVAGHPTGAFIQGSTNFASLQTRGLDFSATYSVDMEEVFGLNLGRFDYRVGGLWLLEQKQFLDSANAANFVENASNVFFPRVRLTSSLTWSPNDVWSVNWSVDWQAAQHNANLRLRDLVAANNADARPYDTYDTGDFARHDFTVRWNAADNLSVRFGVVNAFDIEPAAYLGTATTPNFDPYGTRFFIGLNYRPF
ncbi:MAG: TonB-dependent receptor [Alphaproteobacteria bacterium]|jgi:outer membrane receptor protein involved in Fe transport|nr:TonB-dependent receptor [Alphaproteobacteria bacterium]MBU2041160.1 TonB-dependent receptor [Alphaproteobacteria bacterium]MBU2125535.1 TonB-dependent receptor [Alphaproteobacteria bacterium]MBU2208506.1 TonB-dependent receptor [Alphaproteobacteria bacterium]MBU2289929.1 TonB-dependent receptor [Alphaproteobacteria bacterium]